MNYYNWWLYQYILNQVFEKLNEVEYTIVNPYFGLPEISSDVEEIENTVLSPLYGLSEINRAVNSIENATFNPTYGLEELSTEVIGIESRLDSPTFGLEEIQSEVNQVVDFVNIANTGNKTTGSVIADAGANSIVINLFNNTNTAKLASATVYTLTGSGKSVAYTTGAVVIPPQSTKEFETGTVPNSYEIEFNGLTQGVYSWTSTRTVMGTGTFIAANTFKHSDLAPTIS